MTAQEIALVVAAVKSMIVLACSPAHKLPSQTVFYKAKEAEKIVEESRGKPMTGVFTVYQTCMCRRWRFTRRVAWGGKC